eukprot:TRINITY_DN53_c0_g3_i1.p1 TRINITY_DN53_c0_g3~~TRINITY_DN53_c0_g3_i1.p1  ORF type:complete len:1335 (-),score=277.74 TRINITY_DN53_c0_g3_i1:1063-5067(-)
MSLGGSNSGYIGTEPESPPLRSPSEFSETLARSEGGSFVLQDFSEDPYSFHSIERTHDHSPETDLLSTSDYFSSDTPPSVRSRSEASLHSNLHPNYGEGTTQRRRSTSRLAERRAREDSSSSESSRSTALTQDPLSSTFDPLNNPSSGLLLGDIKGNHADAESHQPNNMFEHKQEEATPLVKTNAVPGSSLDPLSVTSTDAGIGDRMMELDFSPIGGGTRLTDDPKAEILSRWTRFKNWMVGKKVWRPRIIEVGVPPTNKKEFPPNIVRNQKYSVLSFVPVVLFEQFKYFINMYFLVVALSQIFPQLRIGFLFTYIAPLVFVLSVTMLKEAWDDVSRFLRDREANGQEFQRLTVNGVVPIPSSDIKVGDLIVVKTDQRIPADMVLLRTTEKNGASFIRTDQLDGETDWKLRRAVVSTQKLSSDQDLFHYSGSLYAATPLKDIYKFEGTMRFIDPSISSSDDSLGDDATDIIGLQNYQSDSASAKGFSRMESVSVENTLWANTVIASGTVVGLTIYTGTETRAVMNTNHPSTKLGRLDEECNDLSKILFLTMNLLAVMMIVWQGFKGAWWINFFRFVLMFSYIIPISLRVNLDFAKALYSYWINRDKLIEGTVCRTTNIPEELGRVQVLLSDKTGTLTQNDMVFQRVCLGSATFARDSFQELKERLADSFAASPALGSSSRGKLKSKLRHNISSKAQDAVLAMALCHNVTPVLDKSGDDEDGGGEVVSERSENAALGEENGGGLQRRRDGYDELDEDRDVRESFSSTTSRNEPSSFHDFQSTRSYQASSPDEIALVKFSEQCGVILHERDLQSMTLCTPGGGSVTYDLLEVFPFTSTSKRMGIILRNQASGEILFLMKGADVVMKNIVHSSEWLDEECDNMAREGLRTLVFGTRSLTEEEYATFSEQYHHAKAAIHDRKLRVQETIESIEKNLELTCVTGVEDKLQEDVRDTLETLRNAGIKIWMLTGDKVETATCIAISSRLVSRSQSLFKLLVDSAEDARTQMEQFRHLSDYVLVIDGVSLQLCLDNFDKEFIEIARKAPSVVCCRCSPTQKAQVVKLFRTYTDMRTCAIGDGGNDVSMIQEAHVGVGIVGKEGKQASLAADFSINQFSFLKRLTLWHGRNSYKRSAKLSQFVFHRGLIISFLQCVFSAIYYFAAISLFNGYLLVGYSTVFTNLPVFTLILDEDVSEQVAFQFPELYRVLQKGRSLNMKTFFVWMLKSVYQGTVIMILSIFLFEEALINIVAITFTALILTELLNVCCEIHRWHWVMVIGIIATLLTYMLSMVLLPTTFDITFLLTWDFVWKTLVVTLVAVLPIAIAKGIKAVFYPASYMKLM